MKENILALVLILIFLAAPVWASKVRQELIQESTLEQVINSKRLRVGFSTFVPWAMKDKSGGYTGFEIEVAKQLAEDMEVQLELVPTRWSGIIPALLTGKFDIIIGGMGITPARNLKVNFSDPYEYSGMSILANRQLAGDRTSIEEFNSPEMEIVARIGTTAAAAAQRYLPQARLRLFDDEGQALQEVLNSRAVAMVASQPFPEFQSLRYAERLYLPLAGTTFTREPIGFAIRKGDADFLNFLNNWIRIRNAEGWLQDRYDYWFTTEDWRGQIE